MKHEFHAQYSLVLKPDIVQQEGIDFLTGEREQTPKSWEDLRDVVDIFASIQLLTQAIPTSYKDYARVGRPKKPAGLFQVITSGRLNQYLEQQFKEYLIPLNLLPTLPDFTSFPPGTWAMHFKFTLCKPYMSKDDIDFYILENPIRKEWVFKIPYIAPSQWKGTLRAAMVQQLVEWWSDVDDKQNQEKNRNKFVEWRLQLARLFGHEKEVILEGKDLETFLDGIASKELAREYRERWKSFTDSGLMTGRLYFYPTYFTQIGLEVINPHDHKTGAGTLPIYFESVPIDAEGFFTLLYVPLDSIGEPETAISQQGRDDLSLVARGIKAMLTEYGFGAKTSSGFGLAKDEIEGHIVTQKGQKALTHLSTLLEEVGYVQW